jgi:hypothetical protein
MGAYPQGNRRQYMRSLWKRADVDWDFLMWGRPVWYRTKPRPDRYKSRYRARRRFKMEMVREWLEFERWWIMHPIE